jgi:hypothetical protein
VNAPNLFLRPAAAAHDTLPRQCSFRRPDGHKVAHRLDWRRVPKAVSIASLRAGERAPIGLSMPRSGIQLITLSSFSPDDRGSAAYGRLFADLEADAGRIAAGRAVVIDLRGNGGGSSSWSVEVAERLWGKAAVRAAQAAYFRRTSIWWLAHPANLKHFRSVAQRFRAEGRSELAAEVEKTATGIDAALDRGDRFYVENYGSRLSDGAVPAKPITSK